MDLRGSLRSARLLLRLLGQWDRTVVRAWPVRAVVAVGWAMLSDGAVEARAGHGGLLLSTAVRASAARTARH